MSKFTRKLRRNAKKNENYYNGNTGKVLAVSEINNDFARAFTKRVIATKCLPKAIIGPINDNYKDIVTHPDFIPLMKKYFKCHSHIDKYLSDIAVQQLDGNYNVHLTFNYEPNTNWLDVLLLFTKDSLWVRNMVTINHMATVWQNMGITAEDIKALLGNYILPPSHINILQNVLNTMVKTVA